MNASTERRVIALKAELDGIYQLVELSAFTASPEDIATLYARSREIVAEIARLKRNTAAC